MKTTPQLFKLAALFILPSLIGAVACGGEPKGSEDTMTPGDTGGDDDDAAGDDDDDDAGGDDDDDDDGTGTGEDPNACVPGIGDCEEGMKCQPYVKEDGACCVDADQCVALMGDKAHGEACTRERYNDDCGKDVFCFAGTSGKEGAGFCKQLCDGTLPESCADKGMPEAQCVPYNSGKLPMCEVPCHPLRPTCEEGQGCYSAAGMFICARPDPEPGKGKPGDDCHTVQSCNPGGVCILAANLEGCESDSCCALFCDATGESTECTAPHTCVAMFAEDDPEVDPQYLDVGFCGLAADDGG